MNFATNKFYLENGARVANNVARCSLRVTDEN